MLQKYKLWVKSPQQIDENTSLPIGVYTVVEDNETYNKKPDQALIEVNGVQHWVFFDTFITCDSVERLENGAFAVEESFELGVLDFSNLTEEGKREHLDGLHPHWLTVDEYINGCERDEYEHTGYKNLDDALLAAVVNDNTARFVTEKRMSEILINSLKNR